MIDMLTEIVGDKDDTLVVTIHIRSCQTGKEKAFRIPNASTTMGAMANTVIDSANNLGFIVEEVKDKEGRGFFVEEIIGGPRE